MFTIISNFIESLLLLFTQNLFLNFFCVCQEKKRQIYVRIIFVALCFTIALTPPISNPFIFFLFQDFIYTILIVKGHIGYKIKTYIKYELYYYAISAIAALLHTLFTLDYQIYFSNSVYSELTSIIGAFCPYMLLNIYITGKNLSFFPSGRVYKRYFIVTSSICLILLVTCSMLLGSATIAQENLVPLIFTLLLIISLICIFIYRKVVTILEESARAKTETERIAMQLDYQEHIEDNLKALSTLRHDFKNHLIIIQEYAKRGEQSQLDSYISSIREELAPTKLIETPSHAISSLLNAKNETCKRKGILFHIDSCFSKIVIDDFHMITILSNLLDNAITAAEKCETGHINLSISELDSFLEINCNNNHKEQLIIKHGIFQTTKTTQKEIHGIGITSIRKTVETLRGQINIDYTDDSFTVNILLPNY